MLVILGLTMLGNLCCRIQEPHLLGGSGPLLTWELKYTKPQIKWQNGLSLILTFLY